MTAYYLTTAIDYANGDPHLGHAYEKIGADVIARYRRLRGDDVHFLVGMDEHALSARSKRHGASFTLHGVDIHQNHRRPLAAKMFRDARAESHRGARHNSHLVSEFHRAHLICTNGNRLSASSEELPNPRCRDWVAISTLALSTAQRKIDGRFSG